MTEYLVPLKTAIATASCRLVEIVRGTDWQDPDSLRRAITALSALLQELEELRDGLRRLQAEMYPLLVEVREAREAIMRERQGMPAEIRPTRGAVVRYGGYITS